MRLEGPTDVEGGDDGGAAASGEPNHHPLSSRPRSPGSAQKVKGGPGKASERWRGANKRGAGRKTERTDNESECVGREVKVLMGAVLGEGRGGRGGDCGLVSPPSPISIHNKEGAGRGDKPTCNRLNSGAETCIVSSPTLTLIAAARLRTVGQTSEGREGKEKGIHSFSPPSPPSFFTPDLGYPLCTFLSPTHSSQLLLAHLDAYRKGVAPPSPLVNMPPLSEWP